MNTHIIFFLLKLKNAALYKKEVVTITYNKAYIPILKLLYKEGYILTFLITKDTTDKYILTIFLRYLYNFFALSSLKLLSKQSCIKTITYKQLTYNLYDIRKTLFVITNKGIQTHLSCKINKLGGRLFFMC